MRFVFKYIIFDLLMVVNKMFYGKSHPTLSRDNGLDVIGLPQSLDAHIVVHAEQDVLEIGPGKTVFRDFSDAAVFHIGTEQPGQHHADLAFALTAAALEDHHPLALVAGDEAVPYKLLNRWNILEVEQVRQKL